MIELKSNSPTDINFVCDSQDERNFCIAHKEEIFNDFIQNQTKGKFKTLEEYFTGFIEEPEFGEISIRAKWVKTKEWGLEWPYPSITNLQSMFNARYSDSKNDIRLTVQDSRVKKECLNCKKTFLAHSIAEQDFCELCYPIVCRAVFDKSNSNLTCQQLVEKLRNGI